MRVFLCVFDLLRATVSENTLGKFTSNIGPKPLNCLLFQNNIAKLYTNMDQVRKGTRVIGKKLASKQLKPNAGNNNYVVLGPKILRTEILKISKKI